MNRLELFSVEAHEVEHGDILAGIPGRRPVEQILWDASIQADGTTRGAWVYSDDRHREIDRRPLGARVQVLRDTRLPLGVLAGQVGGEVPPSRALPPINRVTMWHWSDWSKP
jgi:hypothetical protein